MAPASTTTADVTSTYDAVSFAWRPGPLTATGSAVQLAPNHPNHTTANSRDATMRKRERPQRGRGRGFRPERRVLAAGDVLEAVSLVLETLGSALLVGEIASPVGVIVNAHVAPFGWVGALPS